MDNQTTLLELITARLLQLSTLKTTFDLKIESYDLPTLSSKDRELYGRQLEEEIKYNKELIRIIKL